MIPVTPEDDRLAQRLFESSDPAIGVGARHHTAPAFFLGRLADSDDHLVVRGRQNGVSGQHGAGAAARQGVQPAVLGTVAA